MASRAQADSPSERPKTPHWTLRVLPLLLLLVLCVAVVGRAMDYLAYTRAVEVGDWTEEWMRKQKQRRWAGDQLGTQRQHGGDRARLLSQLKDKFGLKPSETSRDIFGYTDVFAWNGLFNRNEVTVSSQRNRREMTLPDPVLRLQDPVLLHDRLYDRADVVSKRRIAEVGAPDDGNLVVVRVTVTSRWVTLAWPRW